MLPLWAHIFLSPQQEQNYIITYGALPADARIIPLAEQQQTGWWDGKKRGFMDVAGWITYMEDQANTGIQPSPPPPPQIVTSETYLVWTHQVMAIYQREFFSTPEAGVIFPEMPCRISEFLARTPSS